ncbi:class III (anaerobic) ribonucleoside-triphosphate reductase activating protein NrdG [Marinobacterium zhoushanense]|uniref:Class III (Anaerobic) ribonucleoside-triphosphate reductase activating protein NrdG n=1 Tax=Marinobacterium zhoushanense TaxID=1679163 RepID=A0ABQ1KKM8_9GAMM|nr:anaerobic ribonucleoside-triphosphate reductase activating protein [Marinobacterium zhoushanense]GGB99081.1 class III (anaerobic) ribonucleoside-triphosphate reductase activating protein NrdG [Marinobacterium zhoushanense]
MAMRLRTPKELRVSGMTPLTTIDFPDHLACVLYTQGCPLRCRYCHNPQLIPFGDQLASLSWLEIEEFLHRRQGLLEAVVFSGGEPTLQPALAAAMAVVRELGFKVGLHTAGVSPERLAQLLPLADWVGLDVKAPFHRYPQVTGRNHQAQQNRNSLALLLASDVRFECRTTVDWRLFTPDELHDLARQLAELGVQRYAVQINQARNCLDPELEQTVTLSTEQLRVLKQKLAALFPVFDWRE